MNRLLQSLRAQPQRSWRRAMWCIALAFLAWAAIIYAVRGPVIQRQVVIVAGNPKGAYVADAQQYAARLAEHGVRASIAYTDGWTGIMDRFNDPNSAADIGFAQGMYADRAPANLMAIAAVSREPLWMYARASDVLPTGELATWHDKRIDAGPARTSTHQSVTKLLSVQPNAVARAIYEETGESALQRLINNQTDVMAMITGDSTQAIQLANRSDKLRLLRADAIEVIRAAESRLRPFLLSHASLGQSNGTRLPDTLMLATDTHLIVRAHIAPELQRLLAQIARETHSEATLLRQAQEFPRFRDLDFPPSPYITTNGERPWLESVLPYGGATWMRWLLIWIAPALLLAGLALLALRDILGLRTHDSLRRIDWHLDDVERRLSAAATLPLSDLRRASRVLSTQHERTQRVARSSAMPSEQVSAIQQRLDRLQQRVRDCLNTRLGLHPGEQAWVDRR